MFSRNSLNFVIEFQQAPKENKNLTQNNFTFPLRVIYSNCNNYALRIEKSSNKWNQKLKLCS